MMELYQTKNKYKIYSCSFDGKDYSDRFPNELYEQIDYKDCHNDLDNLRLLYSELYHVYEIWENRLLNDYVGICHYRRFLDFNHYELDDIFQRYDIIVPKGNIGNTGQDGSNGTKILDIIFKETSLNGDNIYSIITDDN